MSISIKSKNDIEKMRIAGQKATSVLEMLRDHVIPGISTAKLDSLAFKFITEELQCIPANIGYGGFPKTLCTSLKYFSSLYTKSIFFFLKKLCPRPL